MPIRQKHWDDCQDLLAAPVTAQKPVDTIHKDENSVAQEMDK